MLKGTYTSWTLFDVTRKYGTIQNLPFSEAVKLIQPQKFDGQTGKGQQRDTVQSHVRKLKSEMVSGNFTPTNISAWLPEEAHNSLTLNENGEFSLVVDESLPMVHTDGGHRFEALLQLNDYYSGLAATAKTEEDRLKYQRWVEQINQMPVTVTVYFDGDPAKDFVNLQSGRAVDRSHMLSLSIAADADKNPTRKRALEIAKALHAAPGSPFHNMVKFDSRGVLPLPISTLCATGASDLGTSLVGLAKLGEKFELNNEVLLNSVVDAHKAIEAAHDATFNNGKPSLMDDGKVLTPIYSGGTKGSATMMVGVGLCLAYYLKAAKKNRAEKADLELVVQAANSTLNKKTGGNFSGPAKRSLLGKFATALFAGSDFPAYKGVPKELVEAISASAFALPALPKAPKPKKQKVLRAPTGAELPNIDA